MVKFILGAKGAGKTKWLIDNANSDIKEGNGNIAFVDVDDDHIFSLDYNVRLINMKDYDVTTLEGFYGFICGMLAMDYDLEKIYVDSVYKVLKLKNEDIEWLYDKLGVVTEKSNVEVYINIDYLKADIPEKLSDSSIEVVKN